MRKLFLVLVLLFSGCICSVAQKSMIEQMKPGQTLTMKVASNGDAYTDPSEYYIIQIVKVDSTYAFSYTYRGTQTKKKMDREKLGSLIDYEKTAPDRHAGLSYDEVIIKCGRKTKRFLTVPDADAVFLKKLGIL